MSRSGNWAAPILGLLLLAPGGDEDLIQWAGDFGEGRRIARETGRPLMVVFR